MIEEAQPVDDFQGIGDILAAEKSKRLAADAQQATNKHFMTNVNYGLATLMGLPTDIPTALLKTVGVLPTDFDPVGSAASIRRGMGVLGMNLPEEESPPDGIAARAGRITGESALPFGGLMLAGGKYANKVQAALTPFQQMLATSFKNPTRTTAGEAVAVIGAAIGGEVAESYFPDHQNAGVMGELFGAMSPAVATQLTLSTAKLFPSVQLFEKGADGVKTLIKGMSPTGSRQRAEKRAAQLAMNPEQALAELTTESILKLDPLTQSGDVGLMSLLKAVEKQGMRDGDKFATEIVNITEESMRIARQQLLGSGDSTAVTNYFQELFTHAGAKSARAIAKLDADASDIAIARKIRAEVENSYTQASNVEDALYGKLPNNASGDPSPIVNKFQSILDSRSASADPADIPDFVYELVGKWVTPSKPTGTSATLITESLEPRFVLGTSMKNPDLANLKDLRSRLGKAVQGERVKPNPNRNKIRILSDLREGVFDTLSEISPEYADAVKYSRELNSKFTQGRIGELLSLERRGAQKVSNEGTLDFLVSGNADEVRMGMQQLEAASPNAVQEVEMGIKAMFGTVARTDSGAFNTATAGRFLQNNAALFESFPTLKSQIETAIRTQRFTDELAGASLGESVSRYTRHKSVASVFLNEDVNTAMTKLLNTTSGAGQASKMNTMVQFARRDKTGEAVEGLKNAFGQMLINGASNSKTQYLSGTRLLANLDDLMPAASKLYSKEEVANIRRIGIELKRIEMREAARIPEGGIIADQPAKIISILSRVGAAQVGRQVAGATGGGTVQTPGIAVSEAKAQLGRLTNDGAAQLLTMAMKDKKVLEDLLGKATPDNIEKFVAKYSNIIPATSVAGVQGVEGLINDDNTGMSIGEAERPSIEDLLNAL